MGIRYTTMGVDAIFGLPPSPDKIETEGFPEGRVRIRFREKEWARAFVKTRQGLRVFAVKEQGGKIMPSIELARTDSVGCGEITT